MVIFITKDSRFQPMTIFSVMNSTYSIFLNSYMYLFRRRFSFFLSKNSPFNK